MEDILLFDCNVHVGKMGYKHRIQRWQTEEILDEMDRSGVAGALIYHGMAKAHSPMYGNRLLDEELAKSSRLFGCWVILPDHLGDFMKPEEMIAEMNRKGIRAAKIFPSTHMFDTDLRTSGRMLDALAHNQIPLFIDASETSLSQLSDILKRYPALTLVLQGQTWSQERRLLPVMDEFPNLCTELSALQSNAIIETLYERYGAERLLFGSGMPAKSPGACRTLIDYARIPDEAKRLIAGGNLARLLGVAPPPAISPKLDEVTEKTSRGLPIEIPVLDSHTHLIEDGGQTGSGMPMLRGDIDAMLTMYRSLGIRKMSIAPWVGINGGDAATGNLISEATIGKYPDEVLSFALIDPNYTPDVAAEAYKWHVEKGFRGMKPYFYLSHIKYTDRIYKPWWQLGNEKRLYALVDPALQSDADYVAQIDELAERYPEVSIFMDHAGRTFEIAELYAPIAKKHPNVTLQLTYTTVTLGVIEWLVQEIGAEKVLFGTDSPMRDPRPQVGWLAYANLSMEDKKLIFGGNFQRILDRYR